MFKHIKRIIPFITAALMLAGCAAPASERIEVKTAVAVKKPLSSEISVSGVLLPKATVQVSAKLSGQVLTVYAEEGGTVKTGDTLAVIDTKQLQAQLEQAEAALKQARSALKSAKSTSYSASSASKAVQSQAETAKISYEAALAAYNSIKALYDAGLATEQELQEAYLKYQLAKSQYNTAKGPAVNQAKNAANAASSNVNTAEAAVEAAEANVKILQLQMDNANVLSPIDGIVINRNINAGEIASMALPLFTIADTSMFKLKGTVSQNALPFIAEGQKADVEIDIYPGRVFTGSITLIGPMAVSTGEYFPIEIGISNDAILKAGLTAGASVKIETANNIVLPLSCVVRENNNSYVYIIKDGLAQKREVTTGLSNTNDIEILSGLFENEAAACSNVNILSDNATVSVLGGPEQGRKG